MFPQGAVTKYAGSKVEASTTRYDRDATWLAARTAEVAWRLGGSSDLMAGIFDSQPFLAAKLRLASRVHRPAGSLRPLRRRAALRLRGGEIADKLFAGQDASLRPDRYSDAIPSRAPSPARIQ
jgi:hypothetical protein